MKEDKSVAKAPIYKKWWFWVIIVLIIGCIGAAAGSRSKDPQKVGESGGSSEQQADNANKTFKVGDVIVVDGMEVSVTSVQRNWTGEYSKPDDGKEYVKVNVQITNKSEDKESYNALSWKMEDSNGAIDGCEFVIDNEDDLNSGELAKGGTKKGSLIFEVPKDDKSLKLHYLPDIFTNNHETIIEL